MQTQTYVQIKILCRQQSESKELRVTTMLLRLLRACAARWRGGNKSGPGRAGALIALYTIQHYGLTAQEDFPH